MSRTKRTAGKTERLAGKKVLVTGAASGIGRCLALEFAREGCPLALVDLNTQGLESVATEVERLGSQAAVFEADVTDPERAAEIADSADPDILVNCAGVALMAEISTMTHDDWRWIVGVNLLGPVNFVSACLPGLVRKGGAHIVNIASGAGLYALPTLGAYSATKFAMVGYSEALSAEVAGSGIDVTCVCPGATYTPILGSRKEGFDTARVDRSLDLLKPLVFTTPEKLASDVVRAVKKGKRLVTHTWIFKLVYYLKRISPGIVYAIQRLSYRMATRRLRFEQGGA